jgi:hypothetical protein
VPGGTGFDQPTLQLVEVDPQPEHLGEAASAADDLEDTARQSPSQVAGAQLGDLTTAGEVCRSPRVSHHHVVAAIDQFAVVLTGASVDRVEVEAAARDRNADRLRELLHQVWGQVRHRAVASVWPYITYRSQPRWRPSSA